MPEYSDAVIAKGICDGVSKLSPGLLLEILSNHLADNGFLKDYFDQILESACSKFDEHSKKLFPKNYSILERMKDYGWVRIRVRVSEFLTYLYFYALMSTSAEDRTIHGENSNPRKLVFSLIRE